MYVCERKREKEKEKERERERKKGRERERERDRGKERKRKKEREGALDIHVDGQTTDCNCCSWRVHLLAKNVHKPPTLHATNPL